MQFNSYIFIMAFLPGIILLYFLANKLHSAAGKVVLVLGSLLFYGYADKTMLLFLLASIIINYFFAILMNHLKQKPIKLLLAIPIIINVCLLLYFKYTNFILENINNLFHTEYTLLTIVLPVGISFFTFQQIAYLVSVSRKELPNTNLLDYLVYITFFPKLLMGPLIEPVDFISQLNHPDTKKVNATHIAWGLKIFSFGLFKKVVLADTFASAVSWGYRNLETATAMDMILITLFYTFEIYFDFSGYSDMAVGSSKMLNIELPINFDSPYKALSIRDFWKRWHISLTKFLTKYIYIPLGGSRKGIVFTCVNTMIVFLVSGVWHGANWTFILWGILHGLLSVFDRIFDKLEEKVFEPVRWFFTFCFVNVLWLLFRSDSIAQWKYIMKRMIYLEDTSISNGLMEYFILPESTFLSDLLHLSYFENHIRGFWMLLFLVVSFGICLIPNNNYKKLRKLTFLSMIAAAIAMVWGILCLGSESQFVYFGF